MSKRKISPNLSEPSGNRASSSRSKFHIVHNDYNNPLHSAPKTFKPDLTSVQQQQTIVIVPAEYPEAIETSDADGNLVTVTPMITTGTGSANNTSSGVREDVYIISEITPDKYVISSAQGSQGSTNSHRPVENVANPITDFSIAVDEPIGQDELNNFVELVEIGGRCANCGLEFDDSSDCQKISQFLISESEHEMTDEGGVGDDGNPVDGVAVSVADALSFIFEVKLNEDGCSESALVHSDTGLCSKCAEILAQMYKSHRDFYKLAAANSYLNILFAKTFSKETPSVVSNVPSSGSPPTSTAAQDPENSQCKSKAQSAKEVHQNQNTLNDNVTFPNHGFQSNLTSATSTVCGGQQNIPQVQVSSIGNPSPLQQFVQMSVNPDPSNNATNPQPNYLVICPLVIAANAGTSTLATVNLPAAATNADDDYFNDLLQPTSPIKRKRNRNRPKFCSTCPECGKTFRSYIKNTLENHINIVHRNLSSHSCEICGRPCSTQKNMETHMKTHLGKSEKGEIVVKMSSKLFLCSMCGTTLKSASSLRLHVAKHSNPKPHACDRCDRKFGDKVSLKKHQVIHEEVFAFSCKCCDEKFKVASLLKEHNMFCVAKKAERPHKCDICSKHFKLKQHLELHLHEIHKYSKEDAREVVYPGLPKKRRENKIIIQNVMTKDAVQPGDNEIIIYVT